MSNFKEITDFLKNYDGDIIHLMEVCGTHTAAISENGIPNMISKKIHLISGPGCPVCVTVASYIDKLVELSMINGNCIVTFGDMLRVCGSKISLREATAIGGKVQMVYSPFEIINLASKNPETNFIFAAVGFETTTPIYAVLVKEIIDKNIKNIKLLTALKTMPAIIDTLCQKGIHVDGFIAPGHVSVVTGSDIFVPLAKKYSIPFVVSDFTGEGILSSIFTLINLKGKGKVCNLYKSAVDEKGNIKAKTEVNKYFTPCKAAWRGFGIVDNSGMALKDEYKFLDAGSFDLISDNAKSNGCCCKEIVTGQMAPPKCPLFGKKCTPDSPYGACMVSTEGSCFNYFVNKRSEN